jgi:formiminotetrahydrofolate cyclodeaminase
MESALREASAVPLEIMRACARAIPLLEELSEKGSAMAVSDAGAGAALCAAALEAASLNVYINAKAMTDGRRAAEISDEADALREEFTARAAAVFNGVLLRLRRR